MTSEYDNDASASVISQLFLDNNDINAFLESDSEDEYEIWR